MDLHGQESRQTRTGSPAVKSGQRIRLISFPGCRFGSAGSPVHANPIPIPRQRGLSVTEKESAGIGRRSKEELHEKNSRGKGFGKGLWQEGI